ncbi:MAG: 30S ribosomal protein S3 [Candidatus Staskawiczbacteria bacterium RIFOXYD2_FULL_37_9]|uniref:Small ribosomal subunit protein uS3 n=1 Tax=Candidatus Staskawiczbacteria bacterium RIFOXYB1_FULL_37_44 TaxID=1802223 RepID=A0A1G2IW17_9BACT|nr:MAG: 30S ribosomal protein S3 [Candidatus Staskawiczbacteria bacterium RIFOXYB1_FULL_37_44]OGZ84069.1 MAG: 30S ribosomal protein S3 [Candidatus Staskawiczbacteria bacterium RIFOXYC1_FULL_37_52]OGZ88907.1 MAG: 30S ribosomal protein S3 [Candidatus Staskawiczbacteria bacterium RIFOXYC2_FULL_37_19]OGZ89856.1 MAG: 30S ribosomal protein S3 [Candidatus Staskawiczbacteria bacterium RIFOXYD1_FULL_37_110]OGZ92950.1 MAG: 30S ribosomal protein S3 [Candidatus Staskawiczbacteria bacterium RIFOXYD2_FULL_37
MAHKVHPKSFRIKGTEDWNIRGFYGKKMPQFLEEDFLIKDFLRKKLAEASVANIEIEHSANKLNIIIETARPGLIIGRGGNGIEVLKKQVENEVRKKIKKFALVKNTTVREYKLEIKEVKNPWISSALVAQMAAQQIEKRIPFRQVLKKSIERVMTNREVKGIRMEVSGRLNGIEIARREWLGNGRMPRNTIRADIDYAQDEARCTYGKIGIKVWIYKGDKFE